MLDVELENLRSAERPIGARQKLLCHLGTAVVPCTALLLSREQLAPGERGFAQLRLARPLLALPGQRFILRGFAQRGNRGRTAAGGTVLAVAPRKRRPGRPEATHGLAVLRDGPPAERLAWLLEDAGPAGLTEAALGRLTASPARVVAAELSALEAQGRALALDALASGLRPVEPTSRAYVGRRCFDGLVARASALVAEHHRANPGVPGIPKEELRRQLVPGLAGLDPHLLQRLLGALASGGGVVVEGETVRSVEHSPRATGADKREKIVAILAEAGLSPPTLTELARTLGLAPAPAVALLKLLVAEGRAVKVSEELYFSAAAIEGLRERLRAHLKAHGAITTPEFKALTGATRKFTIPLGELFDREKLTLRLGEKRVLRGAAGDPAGARR
jgi:selenocysteine-specific elongation factor